MNPTFEVPRELPSILEKLKKNTSIPHYQAHGMPPEAFVSAEMLEAEMKNIFNKSWLCAGRVADIPKPGDYFVFEMTRGSTIITRDKKHRVRAFANICKHRMAKLLEGTGRVRKIVCPYHAWTYDLSGQLTGAPFMGQDFDKSAVCLNELNLEIWMGFVYLSLNKNIKPLASQVTGAEEVIKNYHIERCIPFHRDTWEWDTNWKVMLENFMDPLHIFSVHSKTIQPVLSTKNVVVLGGGPLHSMYVQFKRSGSSYEVDSERVLNEDLNDEEKIKYPVFCVYPGHLIGVSPDRVVWMSIQPLGTDRTRIRWGIDIQPGLLDGDDGTKRQQILDTFDEVNAEDEVIVKAVQVNARAPQASAGRLAQNERCIWEFQRYLSEHLNPVVV